MNDQTPTTQNPDQAVDYFRSNMHKANEADIPVNAYYAGYTRKLAKQTLNGSSSGVAYIIYVLGREDSNQYIRGDVYLSSSPSERVYSDTRGFEPSSWAMTCERMLGDLRDVVHKLDAHYVNSDRLPALNQE